MTASRTASCACGQLSLTLSGDPAFVGICNCTQCQKRTGSVFGVSAYFNRGQVSAVAGEHKAYERSSDAGRSLEAHFCPECGSSVFWYAEAFPDLIGTATGCFADPAFPAPGAVVWAAHKHEWVSFPNGIPQFDQQRPRPA